MSGPGVFVVSLDTELGWGQFDTTDIEAEHASFEETPAVIDALLTLFDRHEIPVTWALVAHLLTECRRPDEPAPDPEWAGWMSKLPCRTGVDSNVWYAPEILDAIRTATVGHDIGLHGYTHMTLGTDGCSKPAAEAEIDRALDILRAAGVDPDSFVYPRNEVGHRDVLAARGIDTYRGVDDRWFERDFVPGLAKPALRYLDEAARITPPMVTPSRREGLVEIPGSQVFRPYRGGWQYTPRHSQRTRAKRGLHRAAETGEIFHMWFHPCNLVGHPDTLLAELDAVLATAATLRDAGKLEVSSMAEVATAFRAGRWQERDDR
jgi:peptidoglycan/xylan/chitin deacetylase (PgdA/CDA1 family)